MRKRIDLRLFLAGCGVLVLVLAGVVAWAALKGPMPPPVLASVTVPLDVISPPPDVAQSNMLPAPPPVVPAGSSSAKPFDKSDARPRIAIVITGLGPSPQIAHAAIDHLPPEVTLAFLPFSNDTGTLADQARAAGHEILLDIPMEPADFPDDDPGPQALMTSNSDAENLKRLDWNLGRASGYVGVANFMGSRFTTAEVKLAPVLTELHDKGLLFFDTRANPLTAVPGLARELKLPYAVADVTIDATASRDAIDQNLAKLEDIATREGRATGVAGTYPVTFERIAEWARALPSKGIALAPISAAVTTPK